MKRISLFVLAAALLTGCCCHSNCPKGNDIVVYQANEKIFAADHSFQAIDARLDQIQDLGVNVLWLMPIHPYGLIKTAHSPYCVRDFKGIKEEFGTMEDLRTLVKHAHERDMRVILDWIANHAAFDNPWVYDHPEWFTGPQSRPEMWWGDVIFFDYDNHPAAREAMSDAMIYWIKEAGIDGFRCDYAEGLTDSVWTLIINDIRAVKPDALLLAETGRYELYESGFDWLYSWDYLAQIQRLYRKGNTEKLFAANDQEMATTPEGKMRLRYITNHDACSEHSSEECYLDQQGLLAASCLTYFLGGVPLIYSSQEIGYMQSINFCVPSEESVIMDWTENPETYAALKKLMAVYHETACLRAGELKRNEQNPAVAYLTYCGEKEKLVILVNVSAEEQCVEMCACLADKEATNLLTGEKVAAAATRTLAPYEYQILKY